MAFQPSIPQEDKAAEQMVSFQLRWPSPVFQGLRLRATVCLQVITLPPLSVNVTPAAQQA